METPRVRILLVEDDPDDVWVIRNLLIDRWDGSYELVHVELLETAIQCCQEQDFDVVLLDLTLPDSQGLETFFRVFAEAEGVPIVVLTGYGDHAVAMKAVQAGAEDYLVKGEVDDDALVRSIRYAIERNRRHQAEDQLRDTSEQFRAAREIQQRLYPRQPPRLEGFDIAGALRPATETAGDYFDFIPMADDRWAIVLGDVSSHGMGPALLMAETRACLRILAQQSSDVGEILTRANRVLVADTGDFHFVTLAMAQLDPVTRQLEYASAGQRGYLLHASGKVTILDSTSLPLGVRESETVPNGPAHTLASGDIVTFFTDGLPDAESHGKVHFGNQRVLELIRDQRDRPAEEIVDSLFHEVDAFCRYRAQRDDMTIVIVKALGGSAS